MQSILRYISCIGLKKWLNKIFRVYAQVAQSVLRALLGTLGLFFVLYICRAVVGCRCFA